MITGRVGHGQSKTMLDQGPVICNWVGRQNFVPVHIPSGHTHAQWIPGKDLAPSLRE